jgi:chromosome segregation ATPase
VELYGVQQNLGKLQQQLDRTVEDQASTARARSDTENDLRQLQEWLESRSMDAKSQRRDHDSHQKELDDLNATLRQVEAYNEQMKGEIATTRTATYAAEESATALEKEKLDQDVLIDVLSENLKRLHQAHALAEAQLIAQRKETGAARATLEEAAREMEAINYEKKQLASQWKTSLVGMARRDEALQATQNALRTQAEETTMIEAETSAYKRQIKEAEGTNEQLTQRLRKMEAEG